MPPEIAVQAALQIRGELAPDMDAGVDQNRVRPRKKDGVPGMKTLRLPYARLCGPDRWNQRVLIMQPSLFAKRVIVQFPNHLNYPA